MGNAEKTVLLINPLWLGLDEPFEHLGLITGCLPAAAAWDGNMQSARRETGGCSIGNDSR